uniref:Saposin B-type domain-containing protein n=1 Tax=Rhabditophanes sp. KR3021 TaxID=114890 RepID=A0AC35UD22_9BILA
MKVLSFLILISSSVSIHASPKCDLCTYIIGIAEKHFIAKDSEASLLTFLTQGCVHVMNQNPGAGHFCMQFVHENIDTIYGDFESGKTTCDVCDATGMCIPPDMCASPTNSKKEDLPKALETSGICNMCHFIIATGEKAFKNGEPESTLLTNLTRECYAFMSTGSQEPTYICLNLVNKYIDTLYADFTKGVTTCSLCNSGDYCTAKDNCQN